MDPSQLSTLTAAARSAGPNLTVAQLVESLRCEVRGLHRSGVWVTGEISGIARPSSGNVFFNLIERRGSATNGRGQVAAMMPVALFARHRGPINEEMRAGGHTAAMTDGMQVRIHARLDVHAAKGRMQLLMDGIDAGYTIAAVAGERELLLRRLDAEGLLTRNRETQMAAVPTRVGIVTAIDSAAHSDIRRVFDQSGFGFMLVEADTAVQGPAAPAAIAAAIRLVAARTQVVLLARGGGSSVDLAAFDHELVARAVAACPRPVIAGIGHQRDRSAADELAHTSCATPTAAAAHVVEIVESAARRLDDVAQRLTRVAAAAHRHNRVRLERAQARLTLTARRHIDAASAALAAADQRVQALDPARVLQRGWSITRHADGTVVRSVRDVRTGDALSTQITDGVLDSTIT